MSLRGPPPRWADLIMQTGHPMRRIFIEKVVVNIGVGASGERLEKAAKLLEELTGQKPSYRRAKRTIREFGVRRGEPIGVMVTLRRDRAVEFLWRALHAVDFKLRASSFDDRGNVCFGIREHILIPGARYDPAVGIWGMDVCVRLARPGYRVAVRRRRRSKVGKKHIVSKSEATEFMRRMLGVEIVER